jgi:hypothetical protein
MKLQELLPVAIIFSFFHSANCNDIDFSNLKNISSPFKSVEKKIQFGIDEHENLIYVVISSSKSDDGLYVATVSSNSVKHRNTISALITNGVKNYGICQCCSLIVIKKNETWRMPLNKIKKDEFYKILADCKSEKDLIQKIRRKQPAESG